MYTFTAADETYQIYEAINNRVQYCLAQKPIFLYMGIIYL